MTNQLYHSRRREARQTTPAPASASSSASSCSPAGGGEAADEASNNKTKQRQLANDLFIALRQKIMACLQGLEAELGSGAAFVVSPWQRAAGGGGGEMAMLRGGLFEKAGVHFSKVFGAVSGEMAAVLSKRNGNHGIAEEFWASGVSVIIHPTSPHIPSVHLNVRRIEAGNWWYGGGADLTPMLAARRHSSDADAERFLAAMRLACERGGVDYPPLHAACAEYFTIKHRGCERGIGGIFFDNHTSGGEAACQLFCTAVVEQFLTAYQAIVRRNAAAAYDDSQLREQERFRSLYAEFNLMYDRGTAFGLRSGGNVESIMSSLPPRVRWD